MPRDTDQLLDAYLVLDAQAGNAQSVGMLVQRWHRRWVHHAQRFTRDDDLARDAAQDAALAIARSIRKLDDPERFRAWAYRIVTRQAINMVRTRQRQRGLHERAANEMTAAPTASASAADCAEHNEMLARIRQLVAQLDDNHRVVVEMYYSDQLTLGEIAHVLRIPRGTVKSRLYHTRKLLASALTEAQGDTHEPA
jgi:RNA polymerase sigma factor (sigma-70 family)